MFYVIILVLDSFMNFEQNIGKNLVKTQKETFEEKKGDLELVKDIVENRFGRENLPKNLVLEMINLRKEIKDRIDKENFVDELDETIDKQIKVLVAEISNLELKKEDIKEITENGEGDIEIIFENGEKVNLGIEEKNLLFSLRVYFDSYKLAHNANKFRNNLNEIKSEITKDSKDRKINFYSEKDKEKEVLDGLKEKYTEAGFSEEELSELIKICDLKDLNDLPIHEIKIMSKVQEIFTHFMKGDKTKYIGISAALMVPAFVQGYAPMFFADAFKDGKPVDIEQMVLYFIASVGAAGVNIFIQKNYKDFINKNYQKEGGVGEFTSKNLTEMPPTEANKFGVETVKNRTKQGLNSYEQVLNTFSFSVLPTVTTLATSAVMLYEKSPILAGGSVVASGITITLDNYLQKHGNFWEKQREAEKTQEEVSKKISQQLIAHMEIILAGEKEKFFKETKEFIEKNKIAQSKRKFFKTIEEGVYRLGAAINFALLGFASLLAGGSADKVLAAILYSQNFNQGIQNLLSTRRDLLQSLRQVMQMELMFNGYAQEEEEKEKGRVSADSMKDSSIKVKNINVEMGDKKILDNISFEIPAGSMTHLSGASGSGKTTLMKVISGYYHPTSGDVNLGGIPVEDIKKNGEDSIYNRIAYLSQFPYLFEGTISDNIKFGLNKDIKNEQIKEVLNDVGLSSRFSSLDEKIYGGSGNSGNTSGGETSRLGLARVLLKIRNSDLKVVFLDEPTASVDEKTKNDIAEIINSEKIKKPDTTFIVISHDGQFVEMLNCGNKIEIERGKVLEK